MKFEEALEKSRKETRERRYNYLALQRKQMKKQIKKEKIEQTAIFIGLLIMLALTIWLAIILNKKAINDCMEVEHNKQYCENVLK